MSAEDLKKSRATRKGALTRSINDLRESITDEETDNVKERLGLIKEKLTNFRQAHDSYVNFISAEANDEQIEECDNYFSEMHGRYVDVVKDARAYLKEVEAEKKENASKQDSSTEALVRYINLPKIELEKFDGNPLKYHMFMAVFNETVDASGESDNIKLTRLLQYTQGDANDAIQRCILMEAGEGYRRAKAILLERFGNDYLVTERIVRNLVDGKQIRSGSALLEFSDELNNSLATLRGMKRLNEVESQAYMIKIVERLQPYLKTRWKRKAMEIKDDKKRYPAFEELVNFISKEAHEASDPVYGNLNVKSNQQMASNVSPKKSNSFTSKTNHKVYPCVLCKGNHKLFYCKSFKEMRPAQRLEFVVSKNLCEICLYDNHKTADCRREAGCTVAGCNRRHNKFIHVDDNGSNPKRSHSQGASSSSNVRLVTANATVSANVHMPVVAVKVNDSEEACALLDSASSNSFCSRELMESLGLEGTPVTYSLSTLNSDEQVKSKSVDLLLSSLDGEETLSIKDVYVVDKIPVLTSCPNVGDYAHFKGLQFVAGDQPVHLLIGQDNAEALVPLDIRKGKKGEPFASKTLFGWSINGPDVLGVVGNKKAVSHFIRSSSGTDVDRLWSLENEGLEKDESSYSQNDKKVIDLWDRETEFIDGHYQVPIPWKDNVAVPNNIAVARSRLFSLKSSLDKRGLTERYNNEVVKLLDSGYAELVPVDDVGKVEKVWYLPHHAVINEKKPDKLRIVFDCASRFQGESLNDKALQGPDLTNKLIHVLLRFRQHQICVMADVESMYYQVRIPPEDRDVLRFVWFDVEGNLVHYRMRCHVFGGIWCSSSATYALRRTVKDSQEVSSFISDVVFNDFYVDDCLKSVSSVDEALHVVHETRKLLASGGFNLTKFVTNNSDVLSSIPDENRAKEVKQLDLDSHSKALGIHWNVQTDELYFLVNVDTEKAVTRKSMLSTIASIYDPLGLVSPMVLVGKLLFQDATRLKYAWDEELPREFGNRWVSWLKSLCELSKIRIRRCVKPTEFDDSVMELHHFSDSSERAFGCCSYLRCIDKKGCIHTSLLISKSKVAPMKAVTIPRLELQAAVLASQVDVLLRKQLSLELVSSHFWVDSELVLKYIANDSRRFKVFVANRVSAIRESTEPEQWHHIPGSENPADVLTRGQTLDSFDAGKFYDGPEFIRRYKSEWSLRPTDVMLPVNDPEIKCDITSCVVDVEEIPATDKLLGYFSDWHRLKRAVAWFLKFKQYLKTGENGLHAGLCVHDVRNSEFAILKYVQRKCYASEIKNLNVGQSVAKSSSVKNLSPFIDEEGLVRVGGRLRNAMISRDSKNPYLVPHSHPIAKLIARDFHDVAHLGTEWVVSLVRRRYWITRVRNVVKSVARNCFKCKRLFASPSSQFMADLPLERIEIGKPPFVEVGLDCFGPILIKQGRSQVKRYGCIFTCLACRAVHLEVLSGMDTDSFLNGLKRFIARRGQPQTIICDNGTNFVGGRSELAKSMKSVDVQRIEKYALIKDIEWKFNPPYASHMGGIWERLIRTVRKVLAGLLDVNLSSRMSDDMLQTLLCEIESILNGRPLTKVSSDVLDDRALTPNHLILLREHVAVPTGQFCEADLYRKKWRAVQHLADQFWRRWLREYVPELQRRCKWLDKNRNFKIGDLVLICDEQTPRCVWPMGIVEQVMTSNDGFVRSAKIRTKSSSFVRPITKLVLLECSD